jgi:hypothetical protein
MGLLIFPAPGDLSQSPHDKGRTPQLTRASGFVEETSLWSLTSTLFVHQLCLAFEFRA